MRALRAAQDISQEELAARVELHRTYIGSIERSERNASIDNIERIAHALGIDICDLLSPV